MVATRVEIDERRSNEPEEGKESRMGKRERFDPYQPCPCGSGEKYKFCCRGTGAVFPGVAELGMARARHVRAIEEVSVEAGPEWFESPFARAFVNGAWRREGLADLYSFRRSGDRFFGHAFLVDVFGLGLKDCYAMRPLSESGLQEIARDKVKSVAEVDLALAQVLVWGGLRYARDNGFKPPACGVRCARAVGGEALRTPAPKSVFGYGGGVHIVGDWEDLAARLDRSLTFDEACGEWNRRGFHFTVGSRDPSFLDRLR